MTVLGSRFMLNIPIVGMLRDGGEFNLSMFKIWKDLCVKEKVLDWFLVAINKQQLHLIKSIDYS